MKQQRAERERRECMDVYSAPFLFTGGELLGKREKERRRWEKDGFTSKDFLKK